MRNLQQAGMLFFNLINIDEFSKEDLMNILLEKLTPLAEKKSHT